nr:hypothetical protein [Endozoicomonas sp.]
GIVSVVGSWRYHAERGSEEGFATTAFARMTVGGCFALLRHPQRRVSQKILNANLYHCRLSREGGNPSRAVDPRLRGDDGWELIIPLATASDYGNKADSVDSAPFMPLGPVGPSGTVVKIILMNG